MEMEMQSRNGAGVAASPGGVFAWTNQQQQQQQQQEQDQGAMQEEGMSYTAMPGNPNDNHNEGGGSNNGSPVAKARESAGSRNSDEDGDAAAAKDVDRAYAIDKARRTKDKITGCYVAIFAVLGAFLRIVIAQLFGEACANPGTVGWLSTGAPLCVTVDGETEQEGGIIFADLPSNLLGSFIMGFFQSCTVLDLAIPMAIAWLSPHHPFQSLDVLHTAIKTGFCGSLTTFSSWNSEMVVMLFGTDQSKPTQIFSALFGYIIGMETAMGSYVCGKSVARKLHRVVNPTLASEADAMDVRLEEGVYMNHDLPDFERRYLHDLDMGNTYGDMWPLGQIDSLAKWRNSTKEARRVRHRHLETLIAVETAALIKNRPIPPNDEAVARSIGFDVDSLKEWVKLKTGELGRLPSVTSIAITNGRPKKQDSWWLSREVAMSTLLGIYAVLLALLYLLHGDDAPTITYRTMVYAMMFAPLGALLRWHLSAWNGRFRSWEGWEWFPLGTFAANVFGCIVSLAAVGLEYRMELSYDSHSFWMIGTIRAIKVGFAGCLTTVSTFAAEASGFIQDKTDHAYPYIIITITTSCIVGSVVYAAIVFLT